MKKIHLSTLAFLLVCTSFGQWNGNPSLGTPVFTYDYPDKQLIGLVAIPDSVGGSISFFNLYYPDDGHYQSCAQKINADGTLAWGDLQNPVAFNPGSGMLARDYSIVPDGHGGAFLCWVDVTAPLNERDLHLLYLDADGHFPWGDKGITVTNSPTKSHDIYSLYPDGQGGVLVCWTTDNFVDSINMYVQRYNNLGQPQWTEGGLEVCTEPGFREGEVINDGNGGALIFFNDTRNDPKGLIHDSCSGGYFYARDLDIYAQHVNAQGVLEWQSEGVAVTTAPGMQFIGTNYAVTDHEGGAIVGYRGPGNTPLKTKLQKINADGILQWPADGILFDMQPAANLFLYQLLPDGLGGTIAFYSKTYGPIGYVNNTDFIQRIRTDGSLAWADTGILIKPINLSGSLKVTIDGWGNTLYSINLTENSNNVIRVHKLDSAGIRKWGVNGILASNYFPESNGLPENRALIMPAKNGSSIVSWKDYRGDYGNNVYACKVLADGSLAAVYVSQANGNWNNPTTWAGGAVPPAGASVIIRHTVTINVNVSCQSIRVQPPGGHTIVNPGRMVEVTQ